ncbi:MAG: citrate synthase [Sumerlaeia bacterium]
MSETVTANINGQTIEFPVIEGTENEKALDISKLRALTGYITFDDGFKNTGSCLSNITYIDGDKGILQYRGYPIEQLSQKSNYLETAYLLYYGELPTPEQLAVFRTKVMDKTPVHQDIRHHFDGFPPGSHPMAILSSMLNSVSYNTPHLTTSDYNDELAIEAATTLIGVTQTIAAYSYRRSLGKPINYANPDLDYAENFLQMMFSEPHKPYNLDPAVVRALDLILILHADHEQNCSTSTVRMIGSTKANLFASVSGGVNALWGPLHGGANVAVLDQLNEIHQSGHTIGEIVARAKDKNSGFRLMGFGHRVYKNFDPRANIMRDATSKIFDALDVNDPLLDIARQLEKVALEDEYFVQRKLYPNVDFYSGIIMRALGIPINMFTVMFAMGRMAGWISNWKEVREDNSSAIYRPR